MSESTAYKIGMLCGFLAVYIVGVIIAKIREKKGQESRCHYDERQEIARGQAYKAAYFTLMAYMLLVAYLQMWVTDIIFLTFAGIFLGVEVSIAVFVIICIIKDAYLALSQSPKRFIILFAVVGVINIITGIQIIICQDTPIIKNKELTNSIVNLSCGILFLVLCLVMAGKQIYNRFHVEMED